MAPSLKTRSRMPLDFGDAWWCRLASPTSSIRRHNSPPKTQSGHHNMESLCKADENLLSCSYGRHQPLAKLVLTWSRVLQQLAGTQWTAHSNQS